MLARTGISCILAPLCLYGCALPLTGARQLSPAPYASSDTVVAVRWQFAPVSRQRRALGSDLWPCTWGADDALYCAWGDGGGFDGNDARNGRVSLGFAKVNGSPSAAEAAGLRGRNVWGQLPYAQVQADFGGKVDSMICVDGSLFAVGGLWTRSNTADPAHHSEVGPLRALMRSDDLARSWSIVTSAPGLSQGAFLNFGRDNRGRIDRYIYLYYQLPGDANRVYLKRIRDDRLTSRSPGERDLQYWHGTRFLGSVASWSPRQKDARPVFVDARGALTPAVVYDTPLKRFLLTIGHHPQDDSSAASAGQMGLFESRHPWGPWATVAYYDHWDGINSHANGDFLGLQIPSKWISPDGRSFWAVFSDVGAYDAFNFVQATLAVKAHWWSPP